VEIGAVYNGSCKPQSCEKQKDNYSTGKHRLPVTKDMVGLTPKYEKIKMTAMKKFCGTRKGAAKQ